jgi:L-2,4-diaminobutyrate decarboxylase
MMLLPLAAGMLLVREEQELQAAFAQRAPYLFHTADDSARIWDQGVRSFQCSRRADVLKLWVSLLRFGRRGIGALYDHLCTLATTFHARVLERRELEALHDPEGNILCFRWIGDGTLDEPTLDLANRTIRERYNRSGAGWITTTVLDGRRVLRVTLMNPRTTPGHIDALLDGIVALGTEIAAESR